MLGNHRVTIHDVAKEASVSIATVSKALNNVNVVKPKTKEKVLAAAEKLNYIPNIMGKQLKKTKTGMLGFYTTSITGPYFSMLVEAIAKEAETRGYSLNVLISSDKTVVLHNMLGGLVDGVIGFEDMLSQHDIEIIKQERIKTVFIDRNIQTKNIGSVVFDSYAKSKQVTHYLLNQGHQKIAFITGFTGTYDSDERLGGFLDTLEEANISFDSTLLIPGYFEERASYNAIKTFFASKPSIVPTAFIAGNDMSALGAVKAIQEIGFSVPEDFSIVSFDGIELLDYFSPKITTVKNPISEQGKLAVTHLLDLIEQDAVGQSFLLKGELTIGDSVKEIG